MTRKEEREQFAAESVKGADKLYGYKYSIKDVESAIIDGAEWADETMLDKVCEWVKKHYIEYAHNRLGQEYIIEDLREAMKE